eukprot:gene49923-40725_t
MGHGDAMFYVGSAFHDGDDALLLASGLRRSAGDAAGAARLLQRAARAGSRHRRSEMQRCAHMSRTAPPPGERGGERRSDTLAR